MMTRGLPLGIRVTLTVLLVAATQTPIASGQCEYNHIFASDGDDHDNYGAAVALDGAVALIGAPSVQGAGVSSGAAYVVRREGLSWVDEQKLVPAGSLPLDLFGTSVALDGNVAVVGAPRTGLSRGSAFVFRYDGGAETWIEEQVLAASDATDGDLFGSAVAIQGDLILVGAPSADHGAVLNAGAVYVFSYNGATWDEDQKLVAPNAVHNDSFGTSLALSGNLALIGDSGRESGGQTNAGAAFVFRENAGVWSLEEELIAPTPGEYVYFGNAVAAYGETLVVGAKQEDTFGNSAGRAYVFQYESPDWVLEVALKGNDTNASDEFGTSVAILQDQIVVGAPRANAPATFSGAAYVFVDEGGGWTQQHRLNAPYGEVQDYLGTSVALGQVVLAGSLFGDGAVGEAGRVYAFDLSLDPGLDCNGNGLLDDCDIVEGASRDCNNDGVPDECQSLPTVIYVKPNAAGDGSGVDWANAFTDLQAALDFAECTSGTVDEIWVAAGTYKPEYSYRSFDLINNVALRGGFAGTETTPEQRNIAAHPSILSGDLDGNDGPNFSNRWDNCLTVVQAISSFNAVLDGFTISGGYAYEPELMDTRGAGMLIANPVTVRNCTFTDNFANLGGAVALEMGADVTFENCVFQWNMADPHGGAFYGFEGGRAILTGCEIVANEAYESGGAFYGVGLWLELTDSFVGFNTAFTGDGGAVNGTWGSALIVDGSTFDQNWAGQSGGAIWIDEGFLEVDRGVFVENFTAGGDGGAIWINLTPAYLINSAFFGNLTAGNGGGVAGVASNLDAINAIFSGNQALHGGALSTDGGSPTLTNVSVANNHAQTTGGGFYFANGGIPRVANAVLWGNTDNDSGGNLSAMQITNAGSAPVVTYTCIQGGWSGAGGPGNVNADPLFVDAPGGDGVPGTTDDDLHALPGSPLIDAGSNFALSPQITTDYDGLPRRADDPNEPDSGAGSAPIIDMGAFEVQPPVACPGDLDGDDDVDFDDLNILLANYGTPAGATPEQGDLDADGDVDFDDLNVLLAVYGTACG